MDWASWKNRLGNGGLLAGFLGAEAAFLFHGGLSDWASRMDAEVFHAANRYYPTSTLCSVAAAFALGAVGFLAGMLVDNR